MAKEKSREGGMENGRKRERYCYPIEPLVGVYRKVLFYLQKERYSAKTNTVWTGKNSPTMYPHSSAQSEPQQAYKDLFKPRVCVYFSAVTPPRPDSLPFLYRGARGGHPRVRRHKDVRRNTFAVLKPSHIHLIAVFSS